MDFRPVLGGESAVSAVTDLLMYLTAAATKYISKSDTCALILILLDFVICIHTYKSVAFMTACTLFLVIPHHGRVAPLVICRTWSHPTLFYPTLVHGVNPAYISRGYPHGGGGLFSVKL